MIWRYLRRDYAAYSAAPRCYAPNIDTQLRHAAARRAGVIVIRAMMNDDCSLICRMPCLRCFAADYAALRVYAITSHAMLYGRATALDTIL